MPVVSREWNGGQPPRPTEPIYVLIFCGVHHQYHWQELKDRVRGCSPHQIQVRQSTVHDEWLGVGQVTIPNEEHALLAFSHLVENGWDGQAIEVSLVAVLNGDSEKSVTIKEPTKCKTRNPSMSARGALTPTTNGHRVTRQPYPQINTAFLTQSKIPYSPNIVSPMSSTIYPMTPANYPPTMILPSPIQTAYPAVNYSIPFSSQSSMAAYPQSPATTTSPTASILSQDTSILTLRTIVMSEIPAATPWQSVRDHIRACVRPQTVNIERVDSLAPAAFSGKQLKSRHAIVTLSSHAQAETVIKKVDGSRMGKGSILKVRWDREKKDLGVGRKGEKMKGGKEMGKKVGRDEDKPRRSIKGKEREEGAPLVVDGSGRHNRTPVEEGNESDRVHVEDIAQKLSRTYIGKAKTDRRR